MKIFKITAPTEIYSREIAGVFFSEGKAETENSVIASWFEGREGFMVVEEPEDLTEALTETSTEDLETQGETSTETQGETGEDNVEKTSKKDSKKKDKDKEGVQGDI